MKMNHRANLGRLIKLYRQTNCMSQKQFSEMLGVSSVTLYRWESGTDIPCHKSMAALSKFIPHIYG